MTPTHVADLATMPTMPAVGATVDYRTADALLRRRGTKIPHGYVGYLRDLRAGR